MDSCKKEDSIHIASVFASGTWSSQVKKSDYSKAAMLLASQATLRRQICHLAAPVFHPFSPGDRHGSFQMILVLSHRVTSNH